MSRKRRITSREAKNLGERERALGLDPDDAAARWLAEYDPPPTPAPPKSLRKSKALHRWKRQKS